MNGNILTLYHASPDMMRDIGDMIHSRGLPIRVLGNTIFFSTNDSAESELVKQFVEDLQTDFTLFFLGVANNSWLEGRMPGHIIQQVNSVIFS